MGKRVAVRIKDIGLWEAADQSVIMVIRGRTRGGGGWIVFEKENPAEV